MKTEQKQLTIIVIIITATHDLSVPISSCTFSWKGCFIITKGAAGIPALLQILCFLMSPLPL